MAGEMEPLRVVFRLDRPVVSPAYPIHLDALLAWSAVHEAQAAGHDDPFSVQEDLPLRACGDGADAVWCASQLMFAQESSPWLEYMTKRFELDDLAPRKGVVYSGGPNSFTPGTGPYKGFLLPVSLMWARTVVAYAIGDRSEVERLLGTIRSIGKLGRAGYGRVQSPVEVVVDERAHDAWRWRTLPTPEKDYAAVEATTRPPYWRRTSRRLAYRPLTIPKELIHE